MLVYPHINPIALQLGPLAIHWYGLMYLIGIGGGWWLASRRARRPDSGWTQQQVADLIFYCAIGVIVGGRVGYMLFYDWPNLLANPLNLFKIWQGGMSFHGGLIGVIISFVCYARKYKKSIFVIADFITPLVPIGLGAGRIGNFINGELWGRITDVPWGMVYPSLGPEPRHPSPLYEFLLEGLVLFIVLWCYSSKPRPTMAVSGLFLLGYGLLRIIAECFRQPDVQLGFLAFNWLTMGQLLSVPMVLLGACMMFKAYRNSSVGDAA